MAVTHWCSHQLLWPSVANGPSNLQLTVTGIAAKDSTYFVGASFYIPTLPTGGPPRKVYPHVYMWWGALVESWVWTSNFDQAVHAGQEKAQKAWLQLQSLTAPGINTRFWGELAPFWTRSHTMHKGVDAEKANPVNLWDTDISCRNSLKYFSWNVSCPTKRILEAIKQLLCCWEKSGKYPTTKETKS